MKNFKQFLKEIPIALKIKRQLWSYFDSSYGHTSLNLIRKFPLYAPFSAGNYKDRSLLTIQTINEIFPVLQDFVRSTHSKKMEIVNINKLATTQEEISNAKKFEEIFNKHGSDKGNYHNYHYLYSWILKDHLQVKCLFEIGLGTNNSKLVSNMGKNGMPGASLRAFKELLPNALIIGADIDRDILFEEDRIKTYFVDQTNPLTFQNISSNIEDQIDLFIDDGLHSPNANVTSLTFAIPKIKLLGWIVIEDISKDAIPLWEVVEKLMPQNFKSYMFEAEGAYIFASQRIS